MNSANNRETKKKEENLSLFRKLETSFKNQTRKIKIVNE